MTFGKVMGGGFPAAAFGGRADVMAMLSPDGPVYQAGTLSGNPVATTAGLATLRLATDEVYAHLDKASQVVREAASSALSEAGVAHVVQHVGNMFSVFFADEGVTEVRDFAGAGAQHVDRFKAFFHSMLEQGVYLPPSAFEVWFLSAAHDDRAVDRIIAALPAAARAAAAVPRSSDGMSAADHRPPAAPRRGAQPAAASSTAGCPATTSPTSGCGWPSGSRRPSATATSPMSRRPRSSAPGRPRSRSADARGIEVVTDARVIESSNIFEGRRFSVGDGIVKRPKAWRHLWNPFRPSWGEPYKAVAARMMAAVYDARDAARGHEAVIVSHQLPIWTTRLHVEHRMFAHNPRNRQCTLCSLTSLMFDGDRLVSLRYSEPAADLIPVRDRRANFSSGTGSATQDAPPS